MPQPLAASKPGVLTSRALPRSTSAICAAESVGRSVQIHAAAAATIGDAKLVPARPDEYPLGSRESGTAPTMSTPGAERSTLCPTVENDATRSFSSVAATVKTCGHEAGNVAGLPESPLFPAAATTRQPLCTAVRMASWSSGSGVVLPKLRLITPGQRFAAVRIPPIAELFVIPRRSPLASQTWSVALG